MSSCFCGRSLSPYRNLQLPFWTYPFPYTPNRTHIIGSGKRDSEAAEPVLKPSIVEEVSLVDEEDEALFDDFEDGKDPFTLLSNWTFEDNIIVYFSFIW